jgi:hypothetical protein
VTAVRLQPDGAVVVAAPAYGLRVAPDGLTAVLRDPDGEHRLTLRPLAALDCVEGPDETTAVEPPRLTADGAIEVRRASTRWTRAAVRIVAHDDAIDVHTTVEGQGRLTDVRLLAARGLAPALPGGLLPSGTSMRTLFSPNPADPARLVLGAAETAAIGVVGDAQPGRGHWFSTPAPLVVAVAPEVLDGPGPGRWTAIGLAAPIAEQTFTQVVHEGGDRAFALRLDHEGHTRVDGAYAAPVVTVAPGQPDAVAAVARHRADLVRLGCAPPVRTRATPAWWSAPMFCGWGAQCHLAATRGGAAPDYATQEHYDAFLDHLERQGLVPGTIVIDDRWQDAYGTNGPDPRRWPDLRGWIARRHERGQRVLLWWKAWDPEGLDPALCVRGPHGDPVAVDPTNPAARVALAESVGQMLGPAGLDADGLKIDFTAQTPTGAGLTAHGAAWGIALLHELLGTVHAAAKAAKADALIVTQTPSPAFVDVTDMVRLNDMLRLDDEGPDPPVVEQMRQRARIAAAACPELLIDTDDWCVPNLAQWRQYLAAKRDLGVPALYYSTHLDRTGERLEAEDYDALRRVWRQPNPRATER